MQNVPNIVRGRLKVSSQPVHHLGADMLTAFAERSLPTLERDIVLEHLSQCAECREIVALALPEQESPLTVASPSRGWLTWPTLRWGFAAAGIAVIVSFGVLRYQRQSNTAIATNRVPPPTVSDAEPENKPVPAVSVPAASLGQDSSALNATLATSEVSPSEVPASKKALPRANESAYQKLPITGRAFGQLAHGPKMTANQLQQNANSFQAQVVPLSPPAPLSKQRLDDALRSAQAAPSAAPVQVQTEADKAESAKNDAPKSLQQLVIHNEELSQQTSAYGTAELKRAKPAEQDSMSGLAPKAPGRSQTTVAEARGSKILPIPRWSIDSAGSLQRSYDQGSTWQEVHVHDSPAVGGQVVARNEPASSGGFTKSKDTLAANADTNDSKKEEAVPTSFRAVAANGNEVWAGASGGLLFHSLDAGTSWTRVVPSVSGSSLTGDVLAIEFTDSQHGKVSTSTSEVWVTADGGQTWKKQ
jgi:Photosynthesis system II assembly factor YCF48/Putative zinc-finger